MTGRGHAQASGSAGRRRSRPQRLSVVLENYLQEAGLQEALERLGVLDDWAGVVGERIARVTRPVEVRQETLVVEVSSSAWLNELSMMSRQIIERLNRRDGPGIAKVRFRLAEDSETHG